MSALNSYLVTAPKLYNVLFLEQLKGKLQAVVDALERVMMMIVLFIVLSRIKHRIPLGRVRTP